MLVVFLNNNSWNT